MTRFQQSPEEALPGRYRPGPSRFHALPLANSFPFEFIAPGNGLFICQRLQTAESPSLKNILSNGSAMSDDAAKPYKTFLTPRPS